MFNFIKAIIFLLFLMPTMVGSAAEAANVDAGQTTCYGNNGPIPCPAPGQSFYGQDAQYMGQAPRYRDNGDGTVTDRSTGLMWTKKDSGRGMNWQKALAYAENLNTAGYDDWRVPDAKELQYIVDYSRSPETTKTVAMDPVFETTVITNEAGERDYPFFWTSTTHLDGPWPGRSAAYIAFGRALGRMHGRTMDVHGAGAQRSDPKTGNARIGHGPQGDAQRVENYVRRAPSSTVPRTASMCTTPTTTAT